MSSLHMVGPRRAIFELQAQRNDAALLINQIEREEKIKSAAKIGLGVVVFGLLCLVISISADRENRRRDIEIQNLQAQGYPMPK